MEEHLPYADLHLYQQTHDNETEKQTFYNPYFTTVLEGGSVFNKQCDIELVAILSSN